jgi:hypothetical protein
MTVIKILEDLNSPETRSGKAIGKPWEKHRKMVIYMDSSYLGIGFND